MTIRAIVAGETEPFLDALVSLLDEFEERLELIGWARCEDEAAELARERCPDLALVSAEIAPVDATSATRAILAANPSCRVIVFGSCASPTEVERAWSAGAAGYVTFDAFSLDLFALALGAEENRLQIRASFPALALP